MSEKKVIIFGAQGMLGQELVREFGAAGYEIFALDRNECDVTDETAVHHVFETIKPTLVINAVAHNGVDVIEERDDEYKKAHLLNVVVPGMFAQLCKKNNIVFVHYSTDYVFSGSNPGGYDESSIPDPVSKYGELKALGEKAVEDVGGSYYLIRLSKLFGKPASSNVAKKSFVDSMLWLVREGGKTELDIVDEEVSSPTYAPDLARFTRGLIEDAPLSGIYHATNSGACTWFGFASKIFEFAGLSPKLTPVTSDTFPRPAKRPDNSVLLNTKRPVQRSWEEALKEYLG